MHLRITIFVLVVASTLLLAQGVCAGDEPVSAPPAVTDRSPVTAKNIVGAWLTGDHDAQEVYELKADGSFRVEIDDQEGTGYLDGTWTFANGVLSMTGAGEDDAIQFRVQRVAKDLLDLQLIDDEPTGVRRWLLRDEKRPPEPSLVGVWNAETTEVPWVLVLRENGDFESRAGKTVTGKWKRSATSVHLLVDGTTDVIIDMNLRWLGREQIELVGTLPDAKPDTLRRGGSSTPRPAPSPLVGVWVARDATTALQLTIRANGTFEQILETGGERSVTRGAWGIQGSQLVVTPEGLTESLRIPFRLVGGNQLTLEAAGAPTTLIRQGGPGRTDGPAGPDTPVPPGGAEGLYGSWLMRSESIEMRITLRRDGTYSEVTRTNGEVESNTGRFEVQGATLIAHVDGTGETVRLNWRLIDANTLEIVDDGGNGARLMRQP